MKKLALTVVLLLTAFIITACGDDENSTDNQSNTNVESQPAMNANDLADKMDELDYTVVDLDVLYSDTEFEGEIENDDGLVEAEFYDPQNEVDARGQDAFDVMFPFVKNLEVHYDMTDEEAIAASLEAFNLPDDFLKAELEVEFKDGTKKTFEVKNHEM